jgi:hypothetical protein
LRTAAELLAGLMALPLWGAMLTMESDPRFPENGFEIGAIAAILGLGVPVFRQIGRPLLWSGLGVVCVALLLFHHFGAANPVDPMSGESYTWSKGQSASWNLRALGAGLAVAGVVRGTVEWILAVRRARGWPVVVTWRRHGKVPPPGP